MLNKFTASTLAAASVFLASCGPSIDPPVHDPVIRDVSDVTVAPDEMYCKREDNAHYHIISTELQKPVLDITLRSDLNGKVTANVHATLEDDGGVLLPDGETASGRGNIATNLQTCSVQVLKDSQQSGFDYDRMNLIYQIK